MYGGQARPTDKLYLKNSQKSVSILHFELLRYLELDLGKENLNQAPLQIIVNKFYNKLHIHSLQNQNKQKNPTYLPVIGKLTHGFCRKDREGMWGSLTLINAYLTYSLNPCISVY